MYERIDSQIVWIKKVYKFGNESWTNHVFKQFTEINQRNIIFTNFYYETTTIIGEIKIYFEYICVDFSPFTHFQAFIKHKYFIIFFYRKINNNNEKKGKNDRISVL